MDKYIHIAKIYKY